MQYESSKGVVQKQKKTVLFMWSVCIGQQANRKMAKNKERHHQHWLAESLFCVFILSAAIWYYFSIVIMFPLLLMAAAWNALRRYSKICSLFTLLYLYIQVFALWLNMTTTGIWDKNIAIDIKFERQINKIAKLSGVV